MSAPLAYRDLRLYVNFFQPQMKLTSKHRRGAKVSKTFDRARTPYRRVLDAPAVPEERLMSTSSSAGVSYRP